MYKIIYPNINTVSIITPLSTDMSDVISIAQKHVPNGLPYNIISSDSLPNDRTFRNAWEFDFSHPDGIGQGV